MSLQYVLTIAGSDPSCGAGIQADIRTFDRCGVYPLSAITAVTYQSAKDFYGFKSTSEELEAQLNSILENYPVEIAKIGMIPDNTCIETIIKIIRKYDLKAVLDPVTISSAGERLAESRLEPKIEKKLLPHITVLTPNISEAEVYSGISLTDKEKYSFQRLKKAAEIILKKMETKTGENPQEKAVIIKSGYDSNANLIDLCLVQKKKGESITNDFRVFRKKKIDFQGNVHGTGCVFSSAIAAYLAKNRSIQKAIEDAEVFFDDRFQKFLTLSEDAKVMNLGYSNEQLDVIRGIKKVYEFISKKKEFRKLIPEVRLNISGALRNAKNKSDIAAIEGRVTVINNFPYGAGPIKFGVSDHTARLILTAKEFDKSINFVINLRYKEKYIKKIKKNSTLLLYEFHRETQPNEVRKKEHSTMQWIIKQSIDKTNKIPDIIWDTGAKGKEPMIRLFAENAENMIEKLEIILNALSF